MPINVPIYTKCDIKTEKQVLKTVEDIVCGLKKELDSSHQLTVREAGRLRVLQALEELQGLLSVSESFSLHTQVLQNRFDELKDAISCFHLYGSYLDSFDDGCNPFIEKIVIAAKSLAHYANLISVNLKVVNTEAENFDASRVDNYSATITVGENETPSSDGNGPVDSKTITLQYPLRSVLNALLVLTDFLATWEDQFSSTDGQEDFKSSLTTFLNALLGVDDVTAITVNLTHEVQSFKVIISVGGAFYLYSSTTTNKFLKITAANDETPELDNGNQQFLQYNGGDYVVTADSLRFIAMENPNDFVARLTELSSDIGDMLSDVDDAISQMDFELNNLQTHYAIQSTTIYGGTDNLDCSGESYQTNDECSCC